MKPFWDITDQEMEASLQNTSWHPSITEYFPGGGMSTRYRTKGGMPATMIRLNLADGLGPCLQVAEGDTIDLPDPVHDALDQRTNPTWPTTWFAPRLTGQGAFRSTYEVMNNWGANHCVMTAGHVGHLYLTLASMLRIPSICTMLKRRGYFVPVPGVPLGLQIWKGPTFGPARLTVRFTANFSFNSKKVNKLHSLPYFGKRVA